MIAPENLSGGVGRNNSYIMGLSGGVIQTIGRKDSIYIKWVKKQQTFLTSILGRKMVKQRHKLNNNNLSRLSIKVIY